MYAVKNAPEAPCPCGVLVLLSVAMLLSMASATPVAAQAAGDTVATRQGAVADEPDEPEKKNKKKKKARDAWRGSWDVALGSAYDDNVFRLAPGQEQELETEAGRYADMNAAHDIANTVRIRSEFRSPGRAARRLDIGAEARLELYTLSRRQSSVRLRISAEQSLSQRDAVSARVSFVPGEFRRNYLNGTGEAGAPEYAAGVQRTLEGRIGYERILLDVRNGPELAASLHMMGAQRSVRDLPWRDRRELGMEVEADLSLGPVGLDLSAEHSRALHAGGAEPVRIGDTVRSMELERDFVATNLGAATTLRLSRNARIGISFEHREHDFRAALEEDPVYGDRDDRRQTYGAELLLRLSRRTDLRLGSDYRRQLTFRPGRGDTGDEAKYSRRTAFVRLEYGR